MKFDFDKSCKNCEIYPNLLENDAKSGDAYGMHAWTSSGQEPSPYTTSSATFHDDQDTH